MHREDLLVDNGCNRQAIEAVDDVSHNLSISHCRTFIIKTVYPVDASAFVVASQDEEVFGVFDLVGEEEADCLKGLFSPVDVVTKEEVVCFWREAAILEQSE